MLTQEVRDHKMAVKFNWNAVHQADFRLQKFIGKLMVLEDMATTKPLENTDSSMPHHESGYSQPIWSTLLALLGIQHFLNQRCAKLLTLL